MRFACLFLLSAAACGKPATSQEPAAATPVAAGIDWPTFLGPKRDSKSPEKGILTEWPEGGPRIVWQRKLGVGYGPCSISNGRLFEFSRHGDKARLTCMESRTGNELWTFEYDTDYVDMYGYNNGPRCCPIIDDGRVYILGAEGMLHCLKTENGKPVWKLDTTAKFGVVQNFFGVGSAPLIDGDLLIVMVGGSPPDSPPIRTGAVQGNGTGIVAFDKRTGEVKYTITDELASYSTPVATTINGKLWCFVFARGGLVGFDPKTGKIRFHYPWRARIIESVNAANPVIVGDRVLITECYGVGSSLLKVKEDGADVIWKDGRVRNYAMAAHWSTPIHVDGFLYGSSGRHSREAELKCIEFSTGKTKWSVPRLTRSSLLYVDGHFIVLGEDGVLRLVKVNPEKYEQVAVAVLRSPDGEPLLEYPAWAAPVLSHGYLYVRGKDRLVCLDVIPEK